MKKIMVLLLALLMICGVTVGYDWVNEIVVNNEAAQSDNNQISEPDEWDTLIFPEGEVVDIEIIVDEDQFAYLCETAMDDDYIPCTIIYNGVTIENVGIRAKGNSSLTGAIKSGNNRFSFKIDFNQYLDQDLFGLESINLNNIYKDPTYMREKLTYEICESLDLPTPDATYGFITINGEPHGLYMVVENVDEVFVSTNFSNIDGDLYKPDGGVGANLAWISDDPADYTGLVLKTNEETSQEEALINMLDILNHGGDIESVLNVDNVLKYAAVCTATVNLDSYLGGMYHNYFLYEQDGYFDIIPWDFNESFGLFTGGRLGSSDLANYNIYQATNSQIGVLFSTLLSDETYLAAYEQYLQEIIEGPLSTEVFTARVAELQSLIDSYVAVDPTSFFTYAEYEASFTATTGSDGLELLTFVEQRSESIASQLAGEVIETEEIATLPPGNNLIGQGNAGKPAQMRPGLVPNDEEMPGIEEMPNGEGMPGVGEIPSGEGMPGVGELPSGEEMPGIGEMPNGEEMPGVGEIPSDEEMPGIGEMPNDEGMPGVGEMPDGAPPLPENQIPSAEGEVQSPINRQERGNARRNDPGLPLEAGQVDEQVKDTSMQDDSQRDTIVMLGGIGIMGILSLVLWLLNERRTR